MKQEKTQFIVKGVSIQAFFHFPENVEMKSLPLIVMGNGYATEWQFGTEPFIKAFTEAGFATLNFDYRGFGGSEGALRQLVDIPGQLDDWRAAIEHAKSQTWIDNKKLALWGSSLGGGHALSMAAEFPEVAAMVAQVPHCCSRAGFKTVTLGAALKGVTYALLDNMKALLGLQPILLPILTEPGTYGVMTHPGWKQHYMSLAEGSPTWRNEIPARSLMKGGDYRPMTTANTIQCPSLLVAAKEDAGVPLESVETTLKHIQRGELFLIEGDHFGVYHGDQLETVVAKELRFFKQHLC